MMAPLAAEPTLDPTSLAACTASGNPVYGDAGSLPADIPNALKGFHSGLTGSFYGGSDHVPRATYGADQSIFDSFTNISQRHRNLL